MSMNTERLQKKAAFRVLRQTNISGRGIVDNRPQSITQRKLIKLTHESNSIQRVRMLGTPAVPDAPGFLLGHPLDRHHIIPNTVFQHAIENQLDVLQGQIDNWVTTFDGQWNGIRLPNGVNRVDNATGTAGRPGHNGNHPQYSTAVEAYCNAHLMNLSDLLNPPAANRQAIATHLRGLITNTAQQNLDAMAVAGEI